MSRVANEKDGICILSLDGGGPGSISQLRIVEEYMSRLAHDRSVDADTMYPADFVDLLGGVGFGGYIALLLGPLRLTVAQAIDEFVILGTEVFVENEGDTPPLPRESSRRLKEVVEDMLRRLQLPVDIKLKDPSLPGSRCKTIVFASPSVDATHCWHFRSYNSRQRDLDCTLVEAICATLAIPPTFSPVAIGSQLRQQTFTSAALGFSNPTKQVLKEAEKEFGEGVHVSLILSIGAGRPTMVSTNASATVGDDQEALLTRILVDSEGVAQELSNQLYGTTAYLRLNVDRGMEGIKSGDWSRLGSIESLTSIYLQSAAVTGSIDSSLRMLEERKGSLSLRQLQRSTSSKAIAKTVPPLSPYFVLRRDYWNKMERHLIAAPCFKQKIVVLSGMGGSGKTQMASYFIQEHHTRYTHVFFIDASSEGSIRGDLQLAIRSLGVGHDEGTAEDALIFMATGPHDGNWVLIFDNADDPNIHLQPFLPKCYSGTIIITTRNPDLGRLAPTEHLELGPMCNSEALETLTRAAHQSTPLEAEEELFARQLTAELGNLAVALVQAGSYCYKMSSKPELPYTFEQYLLLLKQHRIELLEKADTTSLDHYGRGVYATLDLSYKVLPPSAQQFLHLSSFFHHSDISLKMLAFAVRNEFSDAWMFLERPQHHKAVVEHLRMLLCPDGAWNELYIHEIIHSLRSFSLVSITPASKDVFLRFHPLIHSWGRDRLRSSEDIALYRRMATHVVVSCTPRPNIPFYRFLHPHIAVLRDSYPIKAFHANDQVAFGYVFADLGRFHEAVALFQEAINSVEESLGRDHINTYKIHTRLSSAYHRLGKIKQAEELDLEIWENLKRLLGGEHPDSLSAAGNLAGTYRKTGKLEEAILIQREVLAHRRRLFGREHPDSIWSASWLAETYHSQGLWAQCEKIEVEVLALRTKVLGREHRDTMTAALHLASTYAKQNRWEESETLGNEVLEQRQKHLGKEHRYTITATAHMAEVYCAQERWDDAERLGMEVWEQRQKVLGKDNPDTILAAAKLFEIYFKRGRQKEAEDLQREVLEMCQKALGNEHPTTKVIKGLAASSNPSSPSEDKESETVKVIEEQRPQLPSPPPSSYFGFFSRIFQSN